MRLFIAGAALAICAASAADAQAQPGKTYPKVYGATGHLYGPTQAHYQYARQYGREWTGGSNIRGVGHHHHHHHRSFGFGFPGFFGGYGVYGASYGGFYNYGAVGYPAFGPIYNYSPAYPLVIQGHPFILGADPFDNDVLKQDQPIHDLQKLKKLLTPPANRPIAVAVKKSNGAAKQRSLHQQGLGDVAFFDQNFSKAYAHYRDAMRAAPDIPENYFRMGWALAATGHLESAVREIKRGLLLDPYWPLTGISLDERFGPENEIRKNSVLLNAAQWVREDIRDPDRLFLMGVLLHFNNDIDKALKFFETAGQLAGSPQHVQLFLHPQTPPQDQPDADAGDDNDQQPAPPQGQPNPPQPPADTPVPPAPDPEPGEPRAHVPAAQPVSGPVLPVAP